VKHRVPIITAVVGVVMVALVVLLATREQGNDIYTFSLRGRPAPAISADGIMGGGFDMASQRGRWVVVNFFATNCPPCITEHPELVKFSNRHATAGDASVVSVVFGEDPQLVKDFFTERGGDWPVLPNDDGRISNDYGVVKLPESYLVDPAGVVQAKFFGGVTADQLDEVIRTLSGTR
jgi:cytochrome c biogenesis protein CcmG/thiol:disulfide interchange protein DsbE